MILSWIITLSFIYLTFPFIFKILHIIKHLTTNIKVNIGIILFVILLYSKLLWCIHLYKIDIWCGIINSIAVIIFSLCN